MKGHQIFLGGGFIRSIVSGEDVSDLDLFGPSKEALEIHADYLKKELKGRSHKTDNAITVIAPPRKPVQFITRWLFDEPENLIESFDFTIAKCVVWYDAETCKWKSLCSERFYADLASRRLVYCFPKREEEAGGSLMRVRKFLKRGFDIGPTDLGGVMARVFHAVALMKSPPDGTDPEEWYATSITSLLYEVDPLLVVDGLEFRGDHGEIR
jgi:hypothetical protein